MIGLISRLTDQKGLDLINYVIDRLVDDFTQIVVIGTGDPQYENMFRHMHGSTETEFLPISVILMTWLTNFTPLRMHF